MGLNDLIGDGANKRRWEDEKSYRSYYFSKSTQRMLKRVTDAIALDRRGYTLDDAVREAVQLLAEKEGISIDP